MYEVIGIYQQFVVYARSTALNSAQFSAENKKSPAPKRREKSVKKI